MGFKTAALEPESRTVVWNTMGRRRQAPNPAAPPQVQSTLKTQGIVKEAENPEVEVSDG